LQGFWVYLKYAFFIWDQGILQAHSLSAIATLRVNPKALGGLAIGIATLSGGFSLIRAQICQIFEHIHRIVQLCLAIAQVEILCIWTITKTPIPSI